MYCPQCGAENPEGRVTCQQCQAALTQTTAAVIPVPTSTLAIISLIAGFGAWSFVPFIGAVVAVITGHMAIKEIDASNGQIGGRPLAVIGLILGYAHLAFSLVFLGLFFLFGLAWCGTFFSMFACAGLGSLAPSATPAGY